MQKHHPIGIVGGVGPEAGCILQQYIIRETSRVSKVQQDQDHLECFHFSLSDKIADRTDFLTHKIEENPADGAYSVVKILDNIGIQANDTIITGVPCNTFHAKPIFDKLKLMIQKNHLDHIILINMLEETKKYIINTFPKGAQIGLLSTTGTRKSKLYHELLEESGFHVICVPEEQQQEVHNAIYSPEWGIKSVSPITERAQQDFNNFAENLVSQNVNAIILGCTEIPIALKGDNFKNIPLIDPMRILAATLVQKSLQD